MRKKITKRLTPESTAEEAGEPLIEQKEENEATETDNKRAKIKKKK